MKPIIYRGYTIVFTCGWYWALGVPFQTIAKAKKEIDYQLDELVEL